MPPEFEAVKTNDGHLRGYRRADEEARVAFKRHVDQMEPGEFIRVKYTEARNNPMLRKFHKMIDIAFEHWEPDRKHYAYKGKPIEKDRERFRKDVLIACGFYRQVFHTSGRMTLEAESISFAKMTQDRFDEVYAKVATWLIQNVVTNYKLDDLERAAQIEELETFA